MTDDEIKGSLGLLLPHHYPGVAGDEVAYNRADAEAAGHDLDAIDRWVVSVGGRAAKWPDLVRRNLDHAGEVVPGSGLRYWVIPRAAGVARREWE